MRRVRHTAHARAGLLGNPSDLTDGRVIALALANFTAAVTLEPAERFEILPGADDRLTYPSLREGAAALAAQGCDDGVRLLRAALRQLVARRGGLDDLAGDDPRLRFRIAYTTDVPRQVGLAGSSAIVIAALRALADWFGLRMAKAELAELALACEREELGITAGPMDRVVQAYQGLLSMDFAPPRGPRGYRPLDPGLLPPLFVAWDPRGGEPSRKRHSDVRQRFLRGDPDVRRAFALLPTLADAGLDCLARGDTPALMQLVDRNYETRAAIYPPAPLDAELVRLARAGGAVAKLCGSGGAVLGVLPEGPAWPRLEASYAAAGFGFVRARVAPGLGDDA
jgi:glucuronokinase